MKTNPDWNKLRKDNPFQVPEHYFEGLRDQVAERIHQPEDALPWYQEAVLTARPYFALTALFLILFFGIKLYVGPQETSTRPLAQTEEQATNQILEHLMLSTDIMELMAYDLYLEESAGNPAEITRSEQTDADQETEAIIQFLIRGGIDITTIANVF